MDYYTFLKLTHILGSAVLFGTGIGIAFFMLWAHLSRDEYAIAWTAKTVVVADMVFTATAVLLQPVTGVLLARELGLSLFESWIILSIILYVLIGLCWLPVVWLQIRMRNLAVNAVIRGEDLPDEYHRHYKSWFTLGWPAFAGIIVIFWLMIAKPTLW